MALVRALTTWGTIDSPALVATVSLSQILMRGSGQRSPNPLHDERRRNFAKKVLQIDASKLVKVRDRFRSRFSSTVLSRRSLSSRSMCCMLMKSPGGAGRPAADVFQPLARSHTARDTKKLCCE